VAVTVANATGFEIPDIAAYGAASGTAPTISTAHPRHGSSALKCSASAGKSGLQITATSNNFGWTAGNRTSLRVGLYVETMPGGTTNVLVGTIGAFSWNITLDSSGVLHAVIGSGTTVNGDANATLVTGTYYVIEMESDTATASSWNLRWRVNNNVQTTAQYTGSATTPSTSTIVLGQPNGGTSQTFTFHFDDLAISSTAGDYPIGNGYGVLLAVNASGTHSISTGAFQDDGANAITAGETTSHTKLEESTPDSTSWVRQTTGTGGAADYLEYALANTSGSDTPQFVRCAVFDSTAGGGAANGSWKLHDSTDTAGSTAASATFNYREVRLATRAGGAGSWTNGAIDALTVRVGFSGVTVTNSIRLSYAVLEVDYQLSYSITSNNNEAGTITPSGTLTKETDLSSSDLKGTVTPAGVEAASYQPTVTGSETPAGALTKAPSRIFGGTVTPAGTLAVTGQPKEAGTVTPAGALTKEVDQTATDLHGTITPAGGLSRESDATQGGTATPAGALTIQITKNVSGTTTPTGALDSSPVNVTFTGLITPHGALSGTTSGLFAGTITPSAPRPIIEVDVTLRGKCTPTVIGRVTVVGDPGGPGDTGSPGPGDGTGSSGDGSTTLVDCPCTIHVMIGGSLTVTVGRAVSTGPRRRNLLGCGVYQVFATTRGGKSIMVTIPYTSLSWGRVLGDTSQATVEVDGVSGVSDSCAKGLAQLRPRKHEIAIYRSSYLQWAGPISGPLKVVGDKLTIPALDLSSWLDRRRIRHDYDVTGDLADIFAVYIDDAMASDPSPQLLISGGEAGIVGQRSVLAAAHQIAGPLIRELGQSGVPWTVVKRTLFYGLPVTPPDPVALLIDDSYVDQPDVSVLDMGANDVIVAGTSTGEAGDSLYGYARDAASQGEYGLLDQVFRESLILDATSAQARATSDLDLLADPPTVINGGTLTPFAPVLIDDLIPGVQIDNRLLTSLFPVAGPFRLTKLDVQAGNDGSEQVAVTFQPVGSAS
jgi:hypothetical protein